MNRMAAAIVSAMVNDPQFSKAIKEKIGSAVDTKDLEKQKDGNWIRNIVFAFPVPVNGQEVKELSLENETTVETVAKLVRVK